MTKQVLQQALEALEIALARSADPEIPVAIEALREALAQQGEPVGYTNKEGTAFAVKWSGKLPPNITLYAQAAPTAQPCCKEKEELENLLQELSKQSGWASTVIRKYLNEMSSKEK